MTAQNPPLAGSTFSLPVAARAGHLPLVAATAIVGAPSLVFLATHLANPFVAALTVGAGLLSLSLFWWESRRTAEALDARLLAICFSAAFALMLLGGQGHLFYANDDWLLRDAVLRDLVSEPWPVGYWYKGESTFLRAPLGLYLIPALAGKVFGLASAHTALVLQNTALFGSIWYALASAFRPRNRACWVLAGFLAFSGWDIVGTFLAGRAVGVGAHLEHWHGGLQYSSHITQLFWVPNHAAAGWIFVAAYVAWRRERIGPASLAVVFGLSVLWSPLSAIGCLPFLLRALGSDLRGGRLDRAGVLRIALAGGALLPIALFLATDAGRVPHGGQPVDQAFLIGYVIFLALEIGPALAILAFLRSPPTGALLKHDIALAVAVLLFAPLYRIGGSDFVMRASIPALALLALHVAERVASGTAISRRAAAALGVAAALAAVTPAFEIVRAVIRPAFAISACNALTANRFPPNDGPMFHYFARVAAPEPLGISGVFKPPTTMLRADATALCWPDRNPQHRPARARPDDSVTLVRSKE